MTDNRKPEARTRAAQAGRYIDAVTGAIVPAMQPSTTFARNADYDLSGGYLYARNASPTVDHVERLMVELERRRGITCLRFRHGGGCSPGRDSRYRSAHHRARYHVSRRQELDAAPRAKARHRP